MVHRHHCQCPELLLVDDGVADVVAHGPLAPLPVSRALTRQVGQGSETSVYLTTTLQKVPKKPSDTPSFYATTIGLS